MKNSFKTALPCALTVLNLLTGVISIFYASDGKFEDAAWWILISVLLDKLDGTLARTLNVSSEFGMEMDSLADLVSFGLAPAILVRSVIFKTLPADSSFLFVGLTYCGVIAFIVASALRLARFNIIGSENKEFFLGIPTTLCGALISSFYLTGNVYAFSNFFISYSPVLLIFLAFFMLSKIKIPKIKKSESKGFNVFQLIIALFVYTITLARILPEFLLALSVFYLLGSVIYEIKNKKLNIKNTN